MNQWMINKETRRGADNVVAGRRIAGMLQGRRVPWLAASGDHQSLVCEDA